MADIDWETINSKLPYEKTPEEKEKRNEMWTAIDINGNGYASLAEITKGVRDVIAVDELFDCVPAINRAFHHCKDVHKGRCEHGDDYVERREFRLFLLTLRQYFEYYQAFNRIDDNDDRRISKDEFVAPEIKAAVEKWVGEIDNMEEEFDKIDADGKGMILFGEFVDWAIKKNLDLEDDVD